MKRLSFVIVALLALTPSVAAAQQEAAAVAYRPAPRPASTADTAPQLHFTPGIDIFTGYRLTLTNGDAGTEWYHAFVLDRAAASLRVDYGAASARLIFEAVSSAAPGSLLGVSGDSFVARFREAWAAYDIAGWVTVRAGIVPEFTQPALERVERLRPVSRTAVDEFNLHPQSDLGATATLRLPREYGHVALGVYNGEGFDHRELNRGKNIEAGAEVHPFAAVPALAPAGVLVSYVNGSTGTASARADRLTGALLWNQPWLSAGAAFSYAMGLGNEGDRRAWLAQGFARAELASWFILGARAAFFARDVDTKDDRIIALLATVGARLLPGVEAYLAVDRRIPGATASAALPGSDEWRLSAMARLTLGE